MQDLFEIGKEIVWLCEIENGGEKRFVCLLRVCSIMAKHASSDCVAALSLSSKEASALLIASAIALSIS